MLRKNCIISFPLLCSFLFAFMHQLAFAEEHGTPQVAAIQSVDERMQYAEKLMSFLRKIDESIPSLSPSQKEWLEKELEAYNKSKNIRRYLEISKTKEYRISQVKNHLSSMNQALSAIMKKPALKKEIYLWSIMVEELMGAEFWSTLHLLIEEVDLVDTKLFYSDSPKKIDQYGFYLNNGSLPAELILRNIIQPYLEK